MEQSTFDHWFNMRTDSTYVNRCHQKQKLRKRKSPNGDFQIHEDVWAPHPNDQFMYIASIDSIDRLHNTCQVTFVDDGLSYKFPIKHLRHVTREDIKHNRSVDYGHSWSEITNIGAINTYDRYGELQSTRFDEAPNGIFNNNFLLEDNIYSDEKIMDNNQLADVHNDKHHIRQSLISDPVIFVKIPDPENPTITWLNFPVWNASSYAEAEEFAFSCIKEHPDYMDAMERAQNQTQSILSTVETSVKSESQEPSNDHTSPLQQLFGLEHVNLNTDKIEQMSFPLDATNTGSLTNGNVDQTFAMRTIKSHPSLSNKTSNILNQHKSNSKNHVKLSSKFIHTFVLILFIFYYSSVTSTTTNQDLQPTTFVLPNCLLSNCVLILLKIFLSISIIFIGLGQSSLKLWPYPFAVP